MRLTIALLVLAFVLICAAPVLSASHLDVGTTNNYDSSYFGIPLVIKFYFDAQTVLDVAAITIPMELFFTNGNILGPVEPGLQFFSVPDWDVFELATSVSSDHWQATEPDTIFAYFLGAAEPYWNGAGDLCRIEVMPLDTGSIMFTEIFIPPGNVLEVLDRDATFHALNWNAPTITVVPCPSDRMGDVNASGEITSSDVIYVVNFTFKGGPPPLPVINAADMDCNFRVTSSDVIGLVNYVFKSGPEPCPCSNSGL